MARASTAYLVNNLFLPYTNELLEVLFDQTPLGPALTNTDFHLHFNAAGIDCSNHYISTIAQRLQSNFG